MKITAAASYLPLLLCWDIAAGATPAISNLRGNNRQLNNVCSLAQQVEFDCDIADDVVGVFVCRGGSTTCSLATDLVSATDTCGCCSGDTQPGCLDDGDLDGNANEGTIVVGGTGGPSTLTGNGVTLNGTVNNGGASALTINGTMYGGNFTNATANATLWSNTFGNSVNTVNSQVCSAFQKLEFDCDVADDVVGVFVCRNDMTTCVLDDAYLEGDTCGCCPGDNRLECQDDGDEDAMTTQGGGGADVVIINTTPNTGDGLTLEVCSAAQKMEFDCDVADDVVGVYVCRQGVTTCVLNDAYQAGDSCGCCAGDNSIGCQDDGDWDAMEERQGGPF